MSSRPGVPQPERAAQSASRGTIGIRRQVATDLEAIAAINAAAFASHGGTRAFDEMRAKRDDIVSYVAVTDDRTVGHVLFSPVQLATPDGPVDGMGLGQLAVEPRYQRQGIGKQLAETGIAELRARGCPFVIVIGHATYYPRFGFEEGAKHGIHCQWENIPGDSFMVLFPCGRRDDLTGTACFDGI